MVKDSNDASDVQYYLDSFPNGKFVAPAKLRLKQLKGSVPFNPRLTGMMTAFAQEPFSMWCNSHLKNPMKRLRPGMLRFPEGEPANWFRWEDGLYDEDFSGDLYVYHHHLDRAKKRNEMLKKWHVHPTFFHQPNSVDFAWPPNYVGDWNMRVSNIVMSGMSFVHDSNHVPGTWTDSNHVPSTLGTNNIPEPHSGNVGKLNYLDFIDFCGEIASAGRTCSPLWKMNIISQDAKDSKSITEKITSKVSGIHYFELGTEIDFSQHLFNKNLETVKDYIKICREHSRTIKKANSKAKVGIIFSNPLLMEASPDIDGDFNKFVQIHKKVRCGKCGVSKDNHPTDSTNKYVCDDKKICKQCGNKVAPITCNCAISMVGPRVPVGSTWIEKIIHMNKRLVGEGQTAFDGLNIHDYFQITNDTIAGLKGLVAKRAPNSNNVMERQYCTIKNSNGTLWDVSQDDLVSGQFDPLIIDSGDDRNADTTGWDSLPPIPVEKIHNLCMARADWAISRLVDLHDKEDFTNLGLKYWITEWDIMWSLDKETDSGTICPKLGKNITHRYRLQQSITHCLYAAKYLLGMLKHPDVFELATHQIMSGPTTKNALLNSRCVTSGSFLDDGSGSIKNAQYMLPNPPSTDIIPVYMPKYHVFDIMSLIPNNASLHPINMDSSSKKTRLFKNFMHIPSNTTTPGIKSNGKRKKDSDWIEWPRSWLWNQIDLVRIMKGRKNWGAIFINSSDSIETIDVKDFMSGQMKKAGKCNLVADYICPEMYYSADGDDGQEHTFRYPDITHKEYFEGGSQNLPNVPTPIFMWGMLGDEKWMEKKGIEEYQKCICCLPPIKQQPGPCKLVNQFPIFCQQAPSPTRNEWKLSKKQTLDIRDSKDWVPPIKRIVEEKKSVEIGSTTNPPTFDLPAYSFGIIRFNNI